MPLNFNTDVLRFSFRLCREPPLTLHKLNHELLSATGQMTDGKGAASRCHPAAGPGPHGCPGSGTTQRREAKTESPRKKL